MSGYISDLGLYITLDSHELTYKVKVIDECRSGHVLFLYDGSIISCNISDGISKKELLLLTDAIPHIKRSQQVCSSLRDMYVYITCRSRERKGLGDLFESHFTGIYPGFKKFLDPEKKAKLALIKEKEEAYKESLKPKEIILLEI